MQESVCLVPLKNDSGPSGHSLVLQNGPCQNPNLNHHNPKKWSILPTQPKVCPTYIDWYFKIYEHKEEMQAKNSCVTENPCFAPERALKQMSSRLMEGVPLSSYVSGVIFVAPRYLLLSMRRPLLHFSASLLFWHPSFGFQQQHKTTVPKTPQGDPHTNNEPAWLKRKTFCQIVSVSQLPKERDVLGLLVLSFTLLHQLSEQPEKYILNIQYSTLYFPQLKWSLYGCS